MLMNVQRALHGTQPCSTALVVMQKKLRCRAAPRRTSLVRRLKDANAHTSLCLTRFLKERWEKVRRAEQVGSNGQDRQSLRGDEVKVACS